MWRSFAKCVMVTTLTCFRAVFNHGRAKESGIKAVVHWITKFDYRVAKRSLRHSVDIIHVR